MITKKVNRYYCEFCKKANCSASSISRHEKACTLNPNRICRMCAMFDIQQKEIAELKSVLPKLDIIEDGGWIEEVELAMNKLRAITQNCPACILSALRQMKIPVPAIESFDFKTECAEWIKNEEINP